MRGFRIGVGLRGALAAVSGMLAGLDFRAREPLPTKAAEPYKAPFAKRSGRQRSGQKGSRDRLILDRSSSVRKLQRFHNNGTIIPATGRKD